MILASLLLPIAVAAIVFLVQRIRLPVFLAIMATVVVYGIAADMTFQSVGKAFGLGFTSALEQTGLLEFIELDAHGIGRITKLLG